jgi:hypothetical protein
MNRPKTISCGTALTALAAGLAALALLGLAGAASREQKAAAPSLAPDQGTFRILLNGNQVGSEQFRIAPSGPGWLAQDNLQLNLPGQPPERDAARLELHADGNPAHYEWIRAAPDKRSLGVDFLAGAATLVLRKAGSPPFVQRFSLPKLPAVVLDNNMYDHYAILARLYDWNRGGPQQFAVLIPQDEVPGTVTVQAVPGAKTHLLVVHTTDLEVDLYLDSSLRLVRLEVPGSGAEVVRE